MYYDLKISSSDVDLEAIITKAVNYNYSHIAIDVLINLHDDIDKLFIEHRSLIVKAKKLAENFNLKILSRATVVSSNKMDKNRMDLLKGFDIIAMIPISQKSLEDATHNLEIDIITFDSNSFCQLKLGSAIDVAIKRKIYIELDYSAAINGDSDAKVFFFGHAMNIIRRCRYQSFIISSGAKNINHIRPPFDVINLGILCGLSHKNSVRALTRNPESVITHAYTRNSTLGGIFQIKTLGIIPTQTKKTLKASFPKKRSKKNPSNDIQSKICNR